MLYMCICRIKWSFQLSITLNFGLCDMRVVPSYYEFFFKREREREFQSSRNVKRVRLEPGCVLNIPLPCLTRLNPSAQLLWRLIFIDDINLFKFIFLNISINLIAGFNTLGGFKYLGSENVHSPLTKEYSGSNISIFFFYYFSIPKPLLPVAILIIIDHYEDLNCYQNWQLFYEHNWTIKQFWI